MIAEKARNLEINISRFVTLRDNQQNLNGYITRQDDLHNLVSNLKQATEGVAVLINEGILPIQSLPSPESLSDAVNKLKHDFNDNPEAILSQNALHKCRNAVNGRITQINSQGTESWNTYLGKMIPNGNTAILEVLSKIPGFKNTVNEIIQHNLKIQEFVNSPPKSTDELMDFNTMVKKLADLWGSLDSSSLDEKIINFLEATVSCTGASIDMDADVQKWICENHLNSSFKIIVSG